MNIAVDARELAGRATGVGRYLAELLAEWSTSADATRHEWWLYTHAAVNVPASFTDIRVLPGGGGTRWEQWTLARALAGARPDVLFAPGYSAPLTAPCRTVLTVHDVSFSAHPEWFTLREGARRRTLTAWSARRARVVLTDSEFSKREIVQRLGVPADRVRVIPLGMRTAAGGTLAPPRRPGTEVAGGDGGRLEGGALAPPRRESIVLYVGSIFRRRHVDTLIRVFADVVAPQVPDARLEIVGENRTYPPIDLDRLVRELPAPVRKRVTLRSYVDETTLLRLYAAASVFVFLSEYEGFGLTPLEALAAGVPPLVLDTAVAREVYGQAAYYVTGDPGTAGAQIVDLLTNASARAEILNHAGAVLGRYDWSLTAATTLRAITDAAL